MSSHIRQCVQKCKLSTFKNGNLIAFGQLRAALVSLTQTPQGPMGASQVTSVVLASNMNEKVCIYIIGMSIHLSHFSTMIINSLIPFLGSSFPFSFSSPVPR